MSQAYSPLIQLLMVKSTPEKNYNFGHVYSKTPKNPTDITHGLIVHNGKIMYDGFWKNGFMHGDGIFYYHDNTHYVGQFKKGKSHGMGTLYKGKVAIYKGMWKDGARSGYGKQYFSDGCHIGYFENDSPHGIGVRYNTWGEILESGRWINGIKIE